MREEYATLAVKRGVRWSGVGSSAATKLHSMDSLSLSPSGEDFVPLWQIWKDLLWTEATGAKNT